MPEVSLSAVQWSTNSIFTVLAEEKLKHNDHGQIGPLQDPVTWYGINYAGMQMTQWDFQNKGKAGWPGKSSFVLEVPLRYLRPSVIYSVPWDRILQRAYIMLDAAKLIRLVSSPLGRDWERGQLSPHGWRARNFWSYKLCLTLKSAGQENSCRGSFCGNHATRWRKLSKIGKVRERATRKCFSQNKDAVNFEAACCGQGVLEF